MPRSNRINIAGAFLEVARPVWAVRARGRGAGSCFRRLERTFARLTFGCSVADVLGVIYGPSRPRPADRRGAERGGKKRNRKYARHEIPPWNGRPDRPPHIIGRLGPHSRSTVRSCL